MVLVALKYGSKNDIVSDGGKCTVLGLISASSKTKSNKKMNRKVSSIFKKMLPILSNLAVQNLKNWIKSNTLSSYGLQ